MKIVITLLSILFLLKTSQQNQLENCKITKKNNVEQCHQCHQGFTLTENFTCKCQKAHFIHKIQENQDPICVPNSKKLPGCLSYSSNFSCSSCKSDYSPNATPPTQCTFTTCPPEKTLKYDLTNEKICITTTQLIPACLKYNTKLTCNTCKSHHNLNKNQCEFTQCKDLKQRIDSDQDAICIYRTNLTKGCQIYNYNHKTCNQCKPGYNVFLKDNILTCIHIPCNPEEIYRKDPQGDQLCIPNTNQIPQCLSYSLLEKTCIQCKPGYRSLQGSQISIQECSFDSCNSALQEQKKDLDGDKICIPKENLIEGCISYNFQPNNLFCTSCADQYQIQSNGCKLKDCKNSQQIIRLSLSQQRACLENSKTVKGCNQYDPISQNCISCKKNYETLFTRENIIQQCKYQQPCQFLEKKDLEGDKICIKKEQTIEGCQIYNIEAESCNSCKQNYKSEKTSPLSLKTDCIFQSCPADFLPRKDSQGDQFCVPKQQIIPGCFLYNESTYTCIECKKDFQSDQYQKNCTFQPCDSLNFIQETDSHGDNICIEKQGQISKCTKYNPKGIQCTQCEIGHILDSKNNCIFHRCPYGNLKRNDKNGKFVCISQEKIKQGCSQYDPETFDCVICKSSYKSDEKTPISCSFNPCDPNYESIDQNEDKICLSSVQLTEGCQRYNTERENQCERCHLNYTGPNSGTKDCTLIPKIDIIHYPSNPNSPSNPNTPSNPDNNNNNNDINNDDGNNDNGNNTQNPPSSEDQQCSQGQISVQNEQNSSFCMNEQNLISGCNQYDQISLKCKLCSENFSGPDQDNKCNCVSPNQIQKNENGIEMCSSESIKPVKSSGLKKEISFILILISIFLFYI